MASFSPALALACEALSAACNAFVASSFSPALALASEALLADCLACLAVLSSFSHLFLSFSFLLSRWIRSPSSISFNKVAAQRSFLFLASALAALKSSSALFPQNKSWHATKTMLLMDIAGTQIRAKLNGLKVGENFAEKKGGWGFLVPNCCSPMLPQEAEWTTKVKSIEIPLIKNFLIETYSQRPFGFLIAALLAGL